MLRRNPVKDNPYRVREHWTADTEAELREEFDREESRYPAPGYGTMLINVRPDPTGLLWHAEYSRGHSCD